MRVSPMPSGCPANRSMECIIALRSRDTDGLLDQQRSDDADATRHAVASIVHKWFRSVLTAVLFFPSALTAILKAETGSHNPHITASSFSQGISPLNSAKKQRYTSGKSISGYHNM